MGIIESVLYYRVKGNSQRYPRAEEKEALATFAKQAGRSPFPSDAVYVFGLWEELRRGSNRQSGWDREAAIGELS
jgi:hypothetical protein